MSISAVSTIGGHAYSNLGPDAKRAIAVGAALELISRRVSNECHTNQLKNEMEMLSAYADQIQAALNNH